MNVKPLHLAILIGGIGLVFLLSLLPKYVVSDKEKRIKATENQIKQELVVDNSNHQSEKYNAETAAKLTKQISTEKNITVKFALIDSLGLLFKNAFMLDSSANLYNKFAYLDKKYYILSVRDGLTGFQMSQEDDKKKYYQTLCQNVIDQGFKKDPDFLDLKVEELRFKTLASAYNKQAPMQWVGELKTLVEKNPKLISGQIALAEFYTTVGKIDEAILRYKQVIENEKDNLQAHLELVNLYLQKSENNSAKKHLLILQELNKDTKDSFIEDFVNKSLKKLQQ